MWMSIIPLWEFNRHDIFKGLPKNGHTLCRLFKRNIYSITMYYSIIKEDDEPWDLMGFWGFGSRTRCLSSVAGGCFAGKSSRPTSTDDMPILDS